MRKTLRLLALILACALLLAAPALAAASPQVYDLGGYFTADEAASLEAACADFRETTGLDIGIVTTNDANGKLEQEYADDFYEENGFGTDGAYSGLLLLIDMEHRGVWITTEGEAIRYFTDERIEKMYDEVIDSHLADGDFAGGAAAFVALAEQYYDKGIPSDQYNYDTETGEVSRYRSLTAGNVLVALAAGLIAAGVCCGVAVGKYRLKFPDKSYDLAKNAALAVRVSKDDFIGQTITTRRIPKAPPPSSGGGGGRSSVHTSSGGRSHGGGGRRF